MLRRLGQFLPIVLVLATTPAAGAAGDNTGSSWAVAPPHQTANTGWGAVTDCAVAPPATAITCNVVASPSSNVVSYRVSNGWTCPLPTGTIQVMLCAAASGSPLVPHCRPLNQIAVNAGAPFTAGTARNFSSPNPFSGVQESCTAREGN